MRQIAGGDEKALETLYGRYSGVVYSVARRILGDVGAAEEVLQDIFYQLWRAASSFDPARGTLAGWLLVSARNRAITRLRRRGPAGFEEIEEQTVASNFNLESSAAANEMMSLVRNALAALPQEQRQALELAYFEGLTHSEIAERTGDPLGTVKTRLRTALGTLRRTIET
jgi:RNA polymerase sigma-70 factor (ECF subfamily)